MFTLEKLWYFSISIYWNLRKTRQHLPKLFMKREFFKSCLIFYLKSFAWNKQFSKLVHIIGDYLNTEGYLLELACFPRRLKIYMSYLFGVLWQGPWTENIFIICYTNAGFFLSVIQEDHSKSWKMYYEYMTLALGWKRYDPPIYLLKIYVWHK